MLNENQAAQQKPEAVAQKVSAADEIRKYKELMMRESSQRLSLSPRNGSYLGSDEGLAE